MNTIHEALVQEQFVSFRPQIHYAVWPKAYDTWKILHAALQPFGALENSEKLAKFSGLYVLYEG